MPHDVQGVEGEKNHLSITMFLKRKGGGETKTLFLGEAISYLQIFYFHKESLNLGPE